MVAILLWEDLHRGMPIYEYQCSDCKYTFEELQSFSDKPITDCPKCQEKNVSKLISRSAFHLKGSGWYKDHYGLKDKPKKPEK